jgi:hypothetical protein
LGKAIFVTDTKATIPYSKDNFAVQAIDELGHASLVFQYQFVKNTYIR